MLQQAVAVAASLVVGWLRLVVISWLAVLPLVGGAAVVRAVVDRELVGRPAVGLKIFVPNVVGLGVGLLVIEPA